MEKKESAAEEAIEPIEVLRKTGGKQTKYYLKNTKKKVAFAHA